MNVHDVFVYLNVLKKYCSILPYIEKMYVYKRFGRKLLYRWIARLLLNNLDVAIELASGFLFAAKRPQHFANARIKNEVDLMNILNLHYYN